MSRPTRFLSRAAVAALVVLAAPFAITTPAQAAEPSAGMGEAARPTSQLTLEVRGISKLRGQLMVGLYDDEAGFENEVELQGRTIPITSETQRITFDRLPVGRYAIKVFHDKDADGKLDTTFGIPSEPYGFSNNASDPFSAPEWKETRFRLDAQPTTHVIDLD